MSQYPDLVGQISSYYAASGNLEDGITSPWKTLSSLCDTIGGAVSPITVTKDTLTGFWNDIFELPLNIIKAAASAAGVKDKKLDSAAQKAANKFGIGTSPVKNLVLKPVKDLVGLIKALVGLVFKIIMCLEELIIKIGKMIWEQLKRIWELFKALGELVGAAWDTSKAKFRKMKRDAEIARRKREAELQAMKEAAEADGLEYDADAVQEAMDAEYELLRLEADKKIKETEDKKKLAQDTLEKTKKQQMNRYSSMWKNFKKSAWESLKKLKDGVLEILQEIFTAEKMDTSNIDKMVEDITKRATGSVEKVMVTVTNCIMKITELVTSLTGAIREHKANLDDEEFQFEMNEFEQMMQNEGFENFYEMPSVLDGETMTA